MTKQLSTATPSLWKGFIGVVFISRKVNFRVVRSALHWFKGHVVSDPPGSKIASPVWLE